MRVVLTAPEGFSFVWYKDGTEVEGETGRTLIFDPVAVDDSGTYICAYDGGAKTMVETEPFELVVYPEGSLPISGFVSLAIILGAIIIGAPVVLRRQRRYGNC